MIRSPKINSMNAVGQIPAELGPSDKLVLNREETDFRSEDLTRTREGKDVNDVIKSLSALRRHSNNT